MIPRDFVPGHGKGVLTLGGVTVVMGGLAVLLGHKTIGRVLVALGGGASFIGLLISLGYTVFTAGAGTALVGLLRPYLETGGNKAEPARRAGLARPTLYERLRQIEQVLDVSLDSAESRLALHAALLARSATYRAPACPHPGCQVHLTRVW